MLTTANNKTKRMIQERVPFSINFLIKKFTKFYDNVQKYTIYQK